MHHKRPRQTAAHDPFRPFTSSSDLLAESSVIEPTCFVSLLAPLRDPSHYTMAETQTPQEVEIGKALVERL